MAKRKQTFERAARKRKALQRAKRVGKEQDKASEAAAAAKRPRTPAA